MRRSVGVSTVDALGYVYYPCAWCVALTCRDVAYDLAMSRARNGLTMWARRSKAGLVRLAAKPPLPLRSSRQLAREALLRGARQKPSEFGELLRLIRRMKPSIIVEIGAGEGGATYGLRLAAPGATVVSIDMDKEVATILGDSHAPATVAALRRLLHARPVDVLFIDGDHSYEGVRADFEMYAPLVRSGGIVAFHDILPHPAHPEYGVDRCWQELAAVHPHREFVDSSVDWGWGQWGGIGVLTLP